MTCDGCFVWIFYALDADRVFCVDRAQDLVDAEPTYTHMCITKLFKEGRVSHRTVCVCMCAFVLYMYVYPDIIVMVDWTIKISYLLNIM